MSGGSLIHVIGCREQYNKCDQKTSQREHHNNHLVLNITQRVSWQYISLEMKRLNMLCSTSKTTYNQCGINYMVFSIKADIDRYNLTGNEHDTHQLTPYVSTKVL